MAWDVTLVVGGVALTVGVTYLLPEYRVYQVVNIFIRGERVAETSVKGVEAA